MLKSNVASLRGANIIWYNTEMFFPHDKFIYGTRTFVSYQKWTKVNKIKQISYDFVTAILIKRIKFTMLSLYAVYNVLEKGEQ